MKKILIGIGLVIVAFIIFLSLGDKPKDMNESVVYHNTINISRSYVALRLKTDKILNEASEYPDYNTWNKAMTELINNWENLETKAGDLEVQANSMSQKKLSFRLVNEAKAYSKSEISNVFDKAPAGKKIKTLAKYLGVDAKRAYKILKSDQEFVKADAWNEAGDTFKKLETSAVVIKDGCKVAGFIGAAAITGGASATASIGSVGIGGALVGGSATAAEATVMVVTGTDLMLEVGEDTATIALGDNHKAVKVIGNFRSVTDPAASILSLTDIPSNIAKGAHALDKLSVVLMEVDQIRSMVQDGKLLGINIKPADKKVDAKPKVEVAPLQEEEVQQWIEENQKDMQLTEDTAKTEEPVSGEMAEEDGDYISDDLDEWLEGFENLDDWMDDFDEEADTESQEDEAVETEVVDDEEEAEADYSGENVVDKYMREMQGEKMNDLKIFLEYGNKFEELYAEGLISREEQDTLMVEATRLNEGKAEEARSVQEQEDDLLDENEEKYLKINRERPSLEERFRMTEAQREAEEAEYMRKQEARKEWLKAECAHIHSNDPKESEMCYFRGGL